MSEFGGLWKHENNQHVLVPPETECGWPSGGGLKNGHIRYPFHGGTQKEGKEIIKLGRRVTASGMIMHHVLIILALTIQGHMDQNKKCSIISETAQAIPIKFAVKVVWLKVYLMVFFQSDDKKLKTKKKKIFFSQSDDGLLDLN